MLISIFRYKCFILLLSLCLLAVGQENATLIFTKATSKILMGDMEMSLEVKTTDKNNRVKEKSFDVFLAKFGEVEKTKTVMQKPERAKGITIVITHSPNDIGTIEVYTPANGKIRKMKATPENMAMVDSDFPLAKYASVDKDDYEINLLGKQELDGKQCYQVELVEKDGDQGKAELMIEVSSYHVMQIEVFDKNGKKSSVTKLSEYKAVDGAKGKIQPMLIVTDNLLGDKHTEMSFLKITPRNDLKEEDFRLEETSQ